MPFLKALTIAGSDSSAGAGIQADLKTFAALGIYGTSAVTAVTAQNARRIDALTCLPVSLVVSQILSVLSDMGAQAVKTGMLGTPEIIQGVASALSRFPGIPLVVDPVMASTSGAVLLQEGSLEVLRRRLLPLARIVTPNLPEAAALVGKSTAGRIRMHPGHPGNPCHGAPVGRPERRPSSCQSSPVRRAPGKWSTWSTTAGSCTGSADLISREVPNRAPGAPFRRPLRPSWPRGARSWRRCGRPGSI